MNQENNEPSFRESGMNYGMDVDYPDLHQVEKLGFLE